MSDELIEFWRAMYWHRLIRGYEGRASLIVYILAALAGIGAVALLWFGLTGLLIILGVLR